MALVLPANPQQTSANTATASQPAEEKPDIPTRTYQDPKYGVQFRYPTVWTPVAATEIGYLGSAITGIDKASKVDFRAAVRFSPDNNLYSKTDLSYLAFVYAVAPAPTAQVCDKLATSSIDPGDHRQTITVAGVNFTQVEGGDAAMMHRLSSEVDWTWRNGHCFLFEQDFAGIAPKVKEGSRPLTSAEEKSLQRHLSAILASVRFTAKGSQSE